MEKIKLPKAITDASYRQFSVTKWDIADKNTKEKKPERIVLIMIRAWVDSIVDDQTQAADKSKWDAYPKYFAGEVVMKNDLFPNSLPIGYVLKCFWMNVPVTDPTLSVVRTKLNNFIMAGKNRSEMFEAYNKGDFYKTPERIEVDPELDGHKLASMLYKNDEPKKEKPTEKPKPKPESQTSML